MKSVADIMVENRSDLSRIEPQSSVLDAIRIMSERDLGALLVMEKNRLVGILSERDYTRKVTLRNRDAAKTQVREIMSTELICVTPQHTLEQCLNLMNQYSIRHMPVMSQEQVIGFVSILDVANSLLNHKDRMIERLEKYVSETWPF